jgi:PAS domain S-box-containing protein
MPILDPELIVKSDIFAGGGEMGAIMRALDWSRTPLGPVTSWPLALRMMASLLLANRFPMLLWWGPQFCQLYNDPYRPVLGAKHPKSMGQPACECFPEIWDVIGPLVQTPFEGGPATWMEDIPLEVNRHDFLEETHFTIAYSPVPDETVPYGIGGVLATVHEITEKVIGERRVLALRDLGGGSAETKTAEDVCAKAAATLARYPKDIPFALLYLIDPERKIAHLAGQTSVGLETTLASSFAYALDEAEPSVWPIGEVLASQQIQIVEDLPRRLGQTPPGPWSDPPNSAAVVPIRANIAHQLAGVLVAGLSPRLRFDDSYRGFLELTSSQIGTAVANARAYEEERRRAEALAEIDRAKTVFFTNISHELRTPLTLLLGPLEETLATKGLRGEDRERLGLAHRNSIRLLKLVNTLLDFSRIETGRIQASYEPTDLRLLTTELASVFRSAIERAGMRLIVNCQSIPEIVYVDRELWEKIVLNLLSNAFKFTFEGEIEISLRTFDSTLEMSVRDTGTGIPADELPRLFERFHRVSGACGRSYEGSGIGLALVQELVKLHGGVVRVESTLNRGSRFIVSIPMGKSHLPSEHVQTKFSIRPPAVAAEAYVDEAERWLPVPGTLIDEPIAPEAPTGTPALNGGECSTQKELILLADDNADMRDYLARLLRSEYRVYSVSDGLKAIEAARQLRPSLVLTDVMMPGLDGFGLLQAIRADSSLSNTPVILLSARAGEESRVEGLEAGADDYLVKPFTARELMARVATHVRIANIRRESSELERRLRAEAELERHRLEELLAQAPAGIGLMRGPEHRWTFVNEYYVRMTGRNSDADFVGKTLLESLPEIEGQKFLELLDEVYQTGQPYLGSEVKVQLVRTATGKLEDVYFDFVYQPVRDAEEKVEGILVHAIDVTDRKRSDETRTLLASIIDTADDAIISKDLNGIVRSWNEGACRMFGYSAEEMVGQSILRLIPNELRFEEDEILRKLRSGERIDHYATKRKKKNGEMFEVSITISPIRNDSGQVIGASKIARDISDRKRIERMLVQSEKLAATGRMAAAIAHEINNPLEALVNLIFLARMDSSTEGKVYQYLLSAEEELERVSHLARQTLGYYRDAGSPAEVYLHDVIRNVLTVYSSKLRAKEISTDTKFDDHQKLLVSKGEMLQVFSNVIANAIDAMGHGAALSISTQRVCAARDGILAVIKDTGTGIEKEHLSRVFEPFFTTKGDLGTGIGLWIAKQLIERRGGQLSITSNTEKGNSGTTVMAFIPFAPPTPTDSSLASFSDEF